MMPYDDSDFPEEEEQMEAYDEALLEDIFTEKGQSLKYEYDFGDSWIHNIVVEEILPPIEGKRDAIFIKGNNAAPPEDCGGIRSYEHMRNVLGSPKHPEYEEMAEWFGLEDGETYDSTDIGFTDEEINELLMDISELNSEEFESLMYMFENNMLPKNIQDDMLSLIEEIQRQKKQNG